MDVECGGGLVKALDDYGRCPNLDDDDRAWIKNMIKVSDESFEAGKKGHPDAQAQHTIAIACRKAARSVTYATIRCQAGPRPRVDRGQPSGRRTLDASIQSRAVMFTGKTSHHVASLPRTLYHPIAQ